MRALRRAPRQPDSECLEAFPRHLGQQVTGQLRIPEVDRWGAEQQKTETMIAMQARLAKEETVFAKLDRAVPHQMRHGAASAYALRGASDATLLDRGGWGSVKSLRRYRKPARYIARLHLLRQEQLALAAAAPERIVTLIEKKLLEVE